MRAVDEPVEVDSLIRLNEYGPDDIFICCASFENRCLAAANKMGTNFRVRFSVIFVIDEPRHQTLVDTNLYKLQNLLSRRTAEGVFVIRCLRDDPVDGMNQLKGIWSRCHPKDKDEPFVNVDISGFTKIYLLGLMHYLVAELNLGFPRILHTTQTYAPSRLTQGVEQIATVANFFGSISLEKETILVLFLGFEPERSLAVWKHFNPTRTIALVTTPRENNAEYLKYAEKNNVYLLSQPSVEVRNTPADNPYGVRTVLEAIQDETKGSYNMVVGPFGTKPQTVGVFLFWLEHPKAQIVYSFPVEYTKSYLKRKTGPTYILPLAPVVKA